MDGQAGRRLSHRTPSSDPAIRRPSASWSAVGRGPPEDLGHVMDRGPRQPVEPANGRAAEHGELDRPELSGVIARHLQSLGSESLAGRIAGSAHRDDR